MLFPFLSVHWKGAAGEHQLVCASHNEPTVTVFVGTGWLAGGALVMALQALVTIII